LGPALAGTRGVFGGSEEPVEGNNGEITDVPVGSACDGIVDPEGSPHVSEDGDVDRVGALGRVFAVAEAFEERSE
jgi:hypothetical protein